MQRELRIKIDLEMVQPGPNRHWNHEVEVEVPPDYQEQDIAPFVRWQLERAVTELEEQELGEARAARIIAAYDLRIRAIEWLLRNAPHIVRTHPIAQRIRAVINESNDEVFAEWEDLEEGDD